MLSQGKLRIDHFTDPLCFWCYAMEPEMRKIRMLLGDSLDYRIVMGVLSSDIHELVGYDDWSELRYEFIRAQLAENLSQAAERVGMQFSGEYLKTCKPEELLSLPLSTAYCAMEMTDAGYAEAYLRRMRECVYAEGRSLPNNESLADLAGEFPIDLELFRENLESGKAALELERSLEKCRLYNVHAFPTLLIRYEENEVLVSGYKSYDELRWIISQTTKGQVDPGEAEYSVESLERYVDRFGKAAAREIQVMFSLDEEGLADAMMDLVSTGRYTTQSCGSSYFALPKELEPPVA